ncbi:UDP-forming cellulose synthase catalytic subunit [Shewanella avicenniae]|uniref:Cellulose synthase catalytic subunit [UDP-forming] n=1 Tax=Shewanella avicenniae TaxID=2814294 RepID=A0ABX7QXD9_9GAMM|nr:UDP-forming cellulose synthase catalytic subunit [Shewanella avicenniae]QSX35315.1 UDP-forming cellulose synthase catalytic subunit [Shewanella avicenniae]
MEQQKNTFTIMKVLNVVAMLALACIVLLIIATPLDVENQVLFGVSGVILSLIVGRIQTPWARLVLLMMSVVISTRYLAWRATDTLVYSTPLETILGIGLLLAEVYAWIILVLGFIQTVWPLDRKIVPLPEDTRLWPTVDVYVPTYNESLAIVQDTVLAALNLDYPKDKLRVYLLDDGRRPEFGAFASAAGVGYITRNDNKHAKAGNLNNAMKVTKGELICIFDCDHVATRMFLQATVGAFIKEPNLALLQTPHHFYSPDPFERNLHTSIDMPGEGELFYGPVQKGNDFWNAAFFCGSCAVIRRKALDETNGFAVETVTEDAHTALKLQRMGWDTAFLAIPLAAGLATERLSLHIGQRARWARGMCQIFRVDNPLFGKGLKLGQRLCYLNAMLHFQFPLPRFVFITAPLAYLLFGLNIIAASPELLLAYALPHLFHALYTNSILQGRHRYSFWGEIYETVLAFALIRPTLASLWDPSKGKFNVTEKGGLLRDGYFDYEAVRPHLVTLALLIAGITWGAVRMVFNEDFAIQPFVLGLNLVWAGLNVIILLAAVAVAREAKQIRNTVRVDISLPAVLYLSNGRTLRSETYDLSMGGMRLKNPLGAAIQDTMVEEVEINFDGKALLFPVSTVTSDNQYLRFHFRDLPIRQRKKLVNVVMGRADAWVPDHEHPADNPFKSFGGVLRAVMGLFSPEAASNSGWLRWRRSLFGSWKFRIVLVTIIGLGVAIVANRAWAEEGQFDQTISFSDAGFFGPISVSGNGNDIGVHFSIRKDEVAAAASLKLSISYPQSQFPKDSYLEVSLNGQHLQNIELDTFSADGFTSDITLQPALIVSENDLTFRIVGQEFLTCNSEDVTAQKRNEVIIDNNSSIQLQLLRLSRPNNLADFPEPFFDAGMMREVSIPMIIADDASEKIYESSAVVASYFGSLARFRKVDFPVVNSSLPEQNAIAFVVGNNLAGISLPEVTGPEIRIINNPLSPLYKVLLVMGRSGLEVKQAANYLVSGAAMVGEQQPAKLIQIAERKPHDAPNWVATDKPVRLGDLTHESALIAKGIYHGTNEVNFRAPPDIFRWRNKPMKMEVQYLFPEGDWLDERRSKLSVTLNGKYLTSLPVNSVGVWASIMHLFGNDIRQQRAVLEIPPYLLYGENKLEFYFDLRVHPDSDCQQALGSNIVSRVLPTSTIDFSGSEHFTALPNLSYFVSSGFPFTRMADLADTLVVLPSRPTLNEVQAFLELMARMGRSTGLPAYKVTVQQGVNITNSAVDKDVLVVGETGKIAPVFASSPFEVSNGKLSLAQSSLSNTWRTIVSGDWSRQEKSAKRQLDGQEQFSGIASFLSPLNKTRVVVAATDTETANLPTLVGDLALPQAAKNAKGDLLVFNAHQLKAFRVGALNGSGEMTWDMSLRWYFGQHVLLLLVLMLGGILLTATLIYPILHRHAQQRLQHKAEKQDYE